MTQPEVFEEDLLHGQHTMSGGSDQESDKADDEVQSNHSQIHTESEQAHSIEVNDIEYNYNAYHNDMDDNLFD